jgi:hypothetical protein
MSTNLSWQSYSEGRRQEKLAGINYISDTLKIALLDLTYVPDLINHQFFSHLTGEVSGTGYTAGGATLSGKSVTVVGATGEVVFDADDVTWSTATITNAQYAVIYKDTGTPSTSPLILLGTLAAVQSTSAQNFQVIFNLDGIMRD